MIPKPGRAEFDAAWRAHESGDTEEAVRLIDQSFQLLPTNLHCLVVKGCFVREAGRFDEAEAVLKDVVKRHPDVVGVG